MMERREWVALVVLVFILIGVPAITLGYQHWLRPAAASTRVFDIDARIPEDGGFAPDAIRVAVGETVTLRFSSADVTHGIAIGPGLGMDLGHVDPGKVKEITLTFDQPGTYTYYCNAWCSPDHWRMRGTIQVVDPDNPGMVVPAQPDPVIEALIAEEIDIDAVHTGDETRDEDHALTSQPSPQRGEQIIDNLTVPAELVTRDWRRSHTPLEAVDLLAGHNPAASRSDLLDVVAYLWVREASPAVLSASQQLYNKNCAACHGQYGGADGPAASTTAEDPVAFGDAGYMAGMRGDVLYAKIRRGGMGTDMPNFGTLFTPEETWGLVEYLWALAFEPPADSPENRAP